MCGFISGLSTLFQKSVACQNHTVLITNTLGYSLKSGNAMPAAFFFSLKVALDLGSFVVPYEFGDFFFYFCEKCHRNFSRDCIESAEGVV